MDYISDKARQILGYIEDRISDGIPPSVREICYDLHIKSTSTAHKYINELHNAGAIIKGDRLNRSIRLPDNRHNSIPLLGLVTAGIPINAEEHIDSYLCMQVPGYSHKDLFALRVRGDSMINVGIMDDDIVIVAKQSTAKNGQIVVAMIGDDATVKRFYKENGRFRLQAENDDFCPIYTNEVTICGVVVRSIRDY